MMSLELVLFLAVGIPILTLIWFAIGVLQEWAVKDSSKAVVTVVRVVAVLTRAVLVGFVGVGGFLVVRSCG